MTRLVPAAVLLVLLGGAADTLAQESRIAAEFRREAERMRERCGSWSLGGIGSCAMGLATDKPVHLAQGSLAPDNGFALGAAFVTSHAPSETWRLSWSADAVKSFQGAWRAGAYMKLIHVADRPIVVVPAGGSEDDGSDDLAVGAHTVISLYGQTTALREVSYYGIGMDTRRDERTVFGMRQSIAGASLVYPAGGSGAIGRLNLALIGEANVRLVDLRDGAAGGVPQVRDLHDESTAPGLTDQPAFVQLGQGLRLGPALAGDRLRLDYLVMFQQYLTGGSATSSFRRWTVDLSHEVPLYGRSMAVEMRDANVPNDCATTPGGTTCGPVSRDRRGSVVVRGLLVRSSAPVGHAVPFYFQPTLGGRDIDGERQLAAFDNYRFRGSHLLLFQQSLAHTLWGPVGVWLQAEQGMTADRSGGLSRRRLARSYSTGLTLVAGGFPMVKMSLGWGGGEGRHFALTMNTSLLGGSARPSLQ